MEFSGCVPKTGEEQRFCKFSEEGVSLRARAWLGSSIPLSQEGGITQLGGYDVYVVGCEALVKGDSMITDGRKMEIPDERRFCFGSDGIERLSRVITYGQVGKACGSAVDRRVKSPGPEIALRAVYADRRDPGQWFGKIKRVAAFKGGRSCF